MSLKEISPGIFCFSTPVVNAYFVGEHGGPWVLIDSGLPSHAQEIRSAAAKLYGADSVPEAIVLTHGHGDHAGSALELATLWNVDVFAHRLELPYLTGTSKYPPQDPTVGGFMALLIRFVPPPPINLGSRVKLLDAERLPVALRDWECHHTPGHTPGHIVFFRPRDGVLLAGDAIVTVNLDSFVETVARIQRVCRPPTPATTDWNRAAESVRYMAALQPLTIATGHGTPMTGGKAVVQLSELATNFPFPKHGRYVRDPALADETGVISLPPKPPDEFPQRAARLGIAAVAATALVIVARRVRRED